jgi:adenylate cyclase
MGVEIERKFLVDHEKWRRLEKPKGAYLRQGYLAPDAKNTIRIRVADEQGFITIKGISSGISRLEYEYLIPVAEAIEMLDSLTETDVEKVRYRIPFAGHVWEVDEFSGDNSGLVMAEIELKAENEPFDKPEWITREVSDDDRYYNSNLAKNPYKNWGTRL